MAVEADVRAARKGDREAFARLYRRYARAVFLDLAARVRRTQDAEDALQGTFLSAWVHLPRLRRASRFVPWLFRIARNEARDRLRREPRLVLVGGGEDLVAPVAPDEPEVEALRRLMRELKPKSRATVLLRVLEGWSAEEVARAHGVSASTVRRRYAKALEHLRNGLEGSKNDDAQDRTSRRVVL